MLSLLVATCHFVKKLLPILFDTERLSILHEFKSFEVSKSEINPALIRNLQNHIL